jgi:vancomycin resistance protein VanJ
MDSVTVKPRVIPLPNLRRWIGRILAGIVAFYGLFVLVMLCLRVLVGERWIVVAVFNSGLHLFLIPALIVFPLCLLFRRPRLAVLVSPPFALLVAWYGAFFLPNDITVPQGATEISLLTYNLHAERSLLAPMAEVIRESGADIVALQEMTEEAAAYLDVELADIYPYRALHPFPNWYYGRGILSRYPISEDTAWPETSPITMRLQRAVITIQGVDVALYNFHAAPSYPIFGQPYDIGPRAQQIEEVVEMAAREMMPTLMMGDFNTSYLDENYQLIRQHFSDSFYEAGWGLGFTNPDWTYENAREGAGWIPPYNRLDYIFHSDDFLTIEARTWDDSGGSDHLPLYVVVAVKESSE